MQRGRGDRDDFFNSGDPFAGFGGFGSHSSLLSSFWGGRDPFDDPFFTRPLGSMFGPSMFRPSGRPFGDMPASGFLKDQTSHPNTCKGPIIEELKSDDEVEEDKGDKGKKEGGSNEKRDEPEKHSKWSKQPYVQDPDDEAEERKNRHIQHRNDFNRADRGQPQTRSYSFQSSKVTYGGVNGGYYTSSSTRRTGSDGLMVEESKEADTTTGQAKHRISRGIHDKGHSVTRNLNSDGKVDTMQTLHNLNEDELAGFEETWKGNAGIHLPGWNEGFGMHGNTRANTSEQNGQARRRGGWVLPSIEHSRNPDRMRSDNNGARTSASRGRPKTVTINID